MLDTERRKNGKTAQWVREAVAIQQAFGDDAAPAFLGRRHVPPAVTDRVLAAAYQERRQF